VSLRVNSIGEPDAANPHVRFDERGAETEAMVWTATPARGESRRHQLSPRPKATAPLLDSTAVGETKRSHTADQLECRNSSDGLSRTPGGRVATFERGGISGARGVLHRSTLPQLHNWMTMSPVADVPACRRRLVRAKPSDERAAPFDARQLARASRNAAARNITSWESD
jgi:hypothetical protein